MGALRYSRSKFLSDLLLLASSTVCPETPTCSMCDADVMSSTSEEAEKRRRQNHISYVVDSGATLHCINDYNLFESIDHNHPPVKLRVANGKTIVAQAVGTAKLRLQRDDGSTHEILLHNVVYHPDFSHNLLSVRRLWKDSKVKTHFGATNYFRDTATRSKFHFHFNSSFEAQSILSVQDFDAQSSLLHSRFGHCGEKRLRRAITRSINFPKHGDLKHDPTNCDACQQGALRRHPFPKRHTQKFKYFGQRLSSDLCGPFPMSVGGAKYALVIVDASTNEMETYYLPSKSANLVRDCFESYIKKNQHRLQKCRDAGFDVTWRTDNGGEFMSADLDEFCEEFAVKRSFSVPYTPELNAHAERMWGILLRMVRTTLAESGISERFWTYAMDNAVLLHNSLPSEKLEGFMSPKQAVSGQLPDLGRFRVFGCVVWYFLPPHERTSKLGPRALPAINLGCDPDRPGWVIYVPQLNRITTLTHGTFQESKFMKFKDSADHRHPGTVDAPHAPAPIRTPRHPTYDDDVQQPDLTEDQTDLFDDTTTTNPRGFAERRTTVDTETEWGEDHCSDSRCNLPRGHDGPHDYERVATRAEGGTRVRRQTEQSQYERSYVNIVMEDADGQSFCLAASVNLDTMEIPGNFDEADKSRLREKWWEAMRKEIKTLLENKTWKYVDRSDVPAGRKITKSRWVFDLKFLRDGTIERFKARFVACGYSQVYGKDYVHTSSATLRATSFRLFLAVAAGRKLFIDQFDVTAAFTQADIDAEIYVEPPRGFETKGKDGKAQVLRLKKALYGTKQASRLWQQTLVARLTAMGFVQSKHDPCLFRYSGPHGECLIGAYVDDLLCAYSSKETLKWFAEGFIQSESNPEGFLARHMGRVSYFLGMAIDQHADFSISVHQRKYIEKMLNKFVPSHETNAIKHSMPCSPESFSKLSTAKDDQERERVSQLPYLRVVGSLLYVSCMTRADIAFQVAMLCKFMHDPSEDCYKAAIALLLYLGNTKDLVGLYYDGDTSAPKGFGTGGQFNGDQLRKIRKNIEDNAGFVAYSDASWRSKFNEYSAYGYVVYLYGGVVSFSSKFLKIIALSSAEAEYAAACQTCREMAFIRHVCGDLGVILKGHLNLGVDNTAAISICENPGVTARNKHFTDAIHFTRDEYEYGRMQPVYVTTDAQKADGFTKPLSGATYFAWRRMVLPMDHPILP